MSGERRRGRHRASWIARYHKHRSDGSVTDKAKDIEDVRSHNFSASSMELEGLKVRFYGHTAVATYTFIAKGLKYGGKDISGQFRETDTLVESGGKWQVVAAHSTKIQH
jgi:hypothetical protein